MWLKIKACYPHGLFHGKEGLPPSPLRLFQALVAGAFSNSRYRAEKEGFLRWLESLDAPEILAPRAVLGRSRLLNYLPDNDNHSVHERTGGQPIACWAFPRNSQIVFQWDVGSVCPDLNVLEHILRAVPYLGRSEDLVKMRAEVGADTEEIAGLVHYYPSSGYRGWVTPRPGFLDQCIARYPQSTSAAPLNRETYQPIAYSLSPHQADGLPLEVFDVTDLTGQSIAFHPKELQMLSGLTRHAVTGWAQRQEVIKRFGAKRLERFIAGHRNETGEDHICIVPIPSIDNEWNADGRFRRVAIVGNGIQDDQDRAALDALFEELEGAFLIDQGRKVGQLWTRPLHSLGGMEALLGARESQVFRSITPVILKRNPRNSRPISRCLGLSEDEIGEIESIEAFYGPVLPKTDHPRNYRATAYLNETPRINLEIRFKTLKRGPLLFGRGKNSGFGLMYPVD